MTLRSPGSLHGKGVVVNHVPPQPGARPHRSVAAWSKLPGTRSEKRAAWRQLRRAWVARRRAQ